MRQIKFRAWDKNIKGMCFDFCIHLGKNTRFTPTIGSYDKNTIDEYWNKNMEIMQFTGLLDKNGKEIYEGDIVEDDGDWYQVVWAYAGFYADKIRGGGNESLSLEEIASSRDCCRVGNIYENLELLTN